MSVPVEGGGSSPLVAVTGAGGFFGRALAERLAGRARLRGLFRREDERSRAWRQRGGEVLVGDLGDPEALAALVEGAEVVHHLAARKEKSDLEASRRVNVEGTARLARVAREAGVGRLVYTSSISVYAATEGRPPSGAGAGTGARGPEEGADRGLPVLVEEDEPRSLDRLNPYSRTKYEGELALRELAARGEAPELAIARPTNVYGPGGRAWFDDWAERLERVPLAIGRGLPLDLVHVDDVARGLDLAGRAPAAAGETLHLGGESVELAEYLVLIGEAVGIRVRRLPRALDRLARAAIDALHRGRKGNVMSTPLTRRVVYPHDKARRLLGWEPEVALEEALAELGRAYREGRERG